MISRKRIDRRESRLVSDDQDFDFAPGELEALGALKDILRRVAEWPPDSPLSFVMSLAPRTKGLLGESLLKHIAEGAGLTATKAESVAYDLKIAQLRCEVKFSTEDPPRFQQIRDPRLASGELKYDYLVCISGRPHGLAYWLIPAAAVGQLMDEQSISVQHAMSNTKWCTPSRTSSDVFASFRSTFEDLVLGLTEAAG